MKTNWDWKINKIYIDGTNIKHNLIIVESWLSVMLKKNGESNLCAVK